LETLVLQENISSDAFDHILFPMHSLKSLSCTVPGAKGLRSYHTVLEKMSPLRIIKSLQHLESTLVKLKLNGENQDWGNHDGTRLDLSSFKALKLLIVSHFLLFESCGPGPSREGVYLLLPFSLESLTVYFDFASGFLYNSEQEYDRFSAGIVPETAYSWLTELGLHKASSLPNLNEVFIQEAMRYHRGPPFPLVHKYPTHLATVCENSGIKLSVEMRGGYSCLSPDGWGLSI